MPNINVTDFVLGNRAQLFAALEAAGVDMARVIEKVDKGHPFGNWKHPVEVWMRPIVSSERGKHLANYWLSFPKKGSGKTVKFNISTFDAISKWLNQPQR